MRGLFSQKGSCVRVGASLGASLGVSVGIPLCAGALIAGPLTTAALAAPTIGGDANGPQIQILKPAYQDVLKGKTKILIGVKTQKFNPQFVEMFIDDKPATPGPISLSALPSAQYDWDTKLFADGPHKLMVRVTDTQGFRGWAEVNVFINNQKKIDSLPPSLKWQNTKSFQQLSGTTSIQLDALDNFGVKWLFISLSKASEPTVKLRSWMLNRPPYSVKLDTTQVPDGVYNLTAKAYDSFEQEGEAPSLILGVVNSAVNATTVGDMLAGLQRVEESNQKAPTPAKTNRRFTVPAPETDNLNVAPRSSAPKAAASIPKAVASAPKAAASTPRIAAPDPKIALAPSLPPMTVRQVPAAAPATATSPVKTATSPVKTAPKTVVARATAPDLDAASTPEVAAPQLSMPKSATAQAKRSGGAELNLGAEIGGALNEDWRARFARAAAPELAPRVASRPQNAAQIAAPAFSEPESADGSRLSALAPLKVESEMAQTGRVSAPANLIARAESPADVSMPQISAARPASQTKISPRQAIADKIAALKMPREGNREGKTAAPRPTRLAALPRPTKSAARGAINAITVSPLQVNLSESLPAFHVATRTSDVRAVAARYGLPVEVLAANNGWEVSHKLVAGEHVKLPKQLKVAYRGVPVTGDAPSMLVGGTGVTAFRFMFEQAGGKLQWDAKKQRVTALKGQSKVVLSIGSNRAKVGDKDVMLELAAFLFEGRTMVPLRFFEEGLKAEVEWDPQTGRLVIAMAN